MTFEDLEIKDIDVDNIALVENDYELVTVPYILSAVPPAAWKKRFESYACKGTTDIRLSEDRIVKTCAFNLARIRKDGRCWNHLAQCVLYANLDCRESSDFSQLESNTQENVKREREDAIAKLEKIKENLKKS
jgi:hypothetical protein